MVPKSINYYKTLCIEPYQILVDKNDNAHPMAYSIIQDLINKGFKIIIWSEKGVEYCKKILSSDIQNAVSIRKKEINKHVTQEIFFCIDSDIRIASKFKTWSVLLPFDVATSNYNKLFDCIDSYCHYVSYIESALLFNRNNGS